MKPTSDKPSGTVNNALLKFMRQSNVDLQEVKTYLKQKYGISLTEAALRRRILLLSSNH